MILTETTTKNTVLKSKVLDTNQIPRSLDSVLQAKPTAHQPTLDESLGLSEARVVHRVTLD